MESIGRSRLSGKRLILGVTGSIAAYKAVELLRALTQDGAEVRVVMTPAATRFVQPLTFEVLSGYPVAVEPFAPGQDLWHLTWPEQADGIVVAPATANFLARASLGMADDLLSTMLLAADAPLVVAPAMDGGMWDHPTVQGHVATLRARGVTVLDPDEGPLASGRIGRGRLAEARLILEAVYARVAGRQDWVGQRVLVSAGPTQEPVDPVRFLSNRSSGKMGYAVAEAARDRGAEVVLVSGPTSLPAPRGIEILRVRTAEEMQEALAARFDWATVLIMAAAVADFRMKAPSTKKLKKHRTAWSQLEMVPTADILDALAKRRSSQVLVGFAAETENLLPAATDKLVRKGLDLIVANDVGRDGIGFGADHNAAVLIDRHGRTTDVGTLPKRLLADRILDAVGTLRLPGQAGPASNRGGG